MKLEKITHDHLLTKWLKVIIFAILMLAPIFSVAIRCAYVVCNKNAYQSYGGTSVLTENKVSNSNMLLNNYDYVLNIETFIDETNTNTNAISSKYYPKNTIDWSFYNDTITQDIVENTTNFRILRANANYTNIFLFDANGTQLFNLSKSNSTWLNNYTNEQLKIPFTLINSDSTNANYFGGFLVQLQYVQPKLDNVFDYSVAQIKQDQLFNWTQNTGVYTGVNAMTTGLGLTDGTIAILITYWTLLSIIYVIIDIVIEGFVVLTHMISKKAS